MSENHDGLSVNFIETAGEGLKAAEFLANAVEAQTAKLAAQAPVLAKQLVDLRILDATEQEKAASVLADPIEVQNFLGRLLTKQAREVADAATKTAGVLGQPVADPQAVFAHESPFVGQKGGNVKRASDLALMRLVR